MTSLRGRVKLGLMNKDLLIISSVLIAFSIVVYFICKNKNRNPWGWIIFTNLSGFIFNFAPFILIIVLLFLPKTNQISGVSESERKKDVFKLSKEEYVNKYNNGTHASKVNLESEWESENKIKEQM